MEEPGNPVPNPSSGSGNVWLPRFRVRKDENKPATLAKVSDSHWRAARLPVKPLPESGETFKVSRRYF